MRELPTSSWVFGVCVAGEAGPMLLRFLARLAVRRVRAATACASLLAKERLCGGKWPLPCYKDSTGLCALAALPAEARCFTRTLQRSFSRTAAGFERLAGAMPRGRKSRRRRNAKAAEENRNNRKIQASEASKTPMAASVVPSTPEDYLSGPEEDTSTPEKASTPPEEASSTALVQKPVTRSSFQGTKKSLLMSILALIFIMGNSAKEALVWKVLGKLGMQPGRQHSIFGDPKKVVTEEFVRRGYLLYKPVPRSSPVEYEFFWGPRAHVESSKLKVMHFVARVRNRCSKDWPCNYDWDSDDDAEVEAILNSGARGYSTP